MSAINRYRILGVLFAGLSGIFITWQTDIDELAWRAVVAGLGAAFAAMALLCYGQVQRMR